MLQSKLGTKYKTAEPKDWVIGKHEELDPIFIGRLAYLAKSKGVKIKLTEGFRTNARQKELYAQYKAGKLKSAAIPGTSWHEIRLAIDTSTQPIRSMNNAELASYGVCKPIKSEGWHIQPIETKNMGVKANKSLEPVKEVEDLTDERVREIIKEVLNGTSNTPSAWAKDSWEKAKKDGITDGTKPQGVVTREQVIAMLERAIKG